MRNMITIFALVLCFSGCAAVKPIARTVNDIAHEACELFATEQGDRLGMSPAEFCAIHENVKPWLDELLRVNRLAAQRVGAQ